MPFVALLPQLLTYLPALGLLGKAAYSALTLHDLATAGQDVANAAAVVGIGLGVHKTAAAVAK